MPPNQTKTKFLSKWLDSAINNPKELICRTTNQPTNRLTDSIWKLCKRYDIWSNRHIGVSYSTIYDTENNGHIGVRYSTIYDTWSNGLIGVRNSSIDDTVILLLKKLKVTDL